MIRHILRLIWNQRRQNAWLWVELLLVSVFLWFLVDYLCVLGVTYTTPMGFDIRHTYRVVMADLADKSPEYTPEEELAQTPEDYLYTLLDRLRVYPGVEGVCVSDGGMPYYQGNRNITLRIDTIPVNCGYTWVTPEFFEVFRLRGKDGTAAPLMEALRQPNTIVVTSHFEDDSPGFLPLEGKTAYVSGVTSDVEVRIGAVCEPIRRHDYTRSTPFFYQNASSRLSHGASDLEICLRVRPDADGGDFPARFRKDMAQQLRLGNLYLSEVRSLALDRRELLQSYGVENEAKTRLAVACFLLANIFLGVIGTFWFRTEYRKGEMGLRMALGSTRKQLNSIMVYEGVLLLMLAFIPALVISVNIVHMDFIDTYLLPFTWLRFLVCQAITFALIVVMIICGVWYPARQIAHLEPAEALHYE